MKRILITGFAPFNQETINPSFEAIKNLPDKMGDHIIKKMELPTEFFNSGKLLIEELNKFNPDIILMFGQAGGRNTISIERIAINIDDSLIPDNTGYQPIDQLINSNGPTGYLSTLPIRNIYNRLNEAGFPVSISNSAGTYVCNHLMYKVLDYISNHKDHQIAGFIHVPYIHEQVKDKPNMFSMDLTENTQAIKVIITLLTEASL